MVGDHARGGAVDIKAAFVRQPLHGEATTDIPAHHMKENDHKKPANYERCGNPTAPRQVAVEISGKSDNKDNKRENDAGP